MLRYGLILGLAATTAWGATGTRATRGSEIASKWQFAGENQGIRFFFKVANECREAGARVELKLENSLDHSVTVSFRLVDPDWKQTFKRDLGTNETDTGIRFTPEEGTACHPYVDEVYVEARKTQVSRVGDAEQTASPPVAETPAEP